MDDQPGHTMDDQPGQSNEPPGVEFTNVGLPVRIRQASLAAPLRDGPPPPDPSPDTPKPSRTPEEIRAMMASYQDATLRARTEAAKSLEPDPQPPVGWDRPDADRPAENPQPPVGWDCPDADRPAENPPPPGDDGDTAQHKPA
jgi:hypothetical protein